MLRKHIDGIVVGLYVLMGIVIAVAMGGVMYFTVR